MALIQCPECKGKVSDSANTCPHCGFNLTKQKAKIPEHLQPKSSPVLFIISMVSFGLLIMVLVAAFYEAVILLSLVSILGFIWAMSRKEPGYIWSLTTMIISILILVIGVGSLVNEIQERRYQKDLDDIHEKYKERWDLTYNERMEIWNEIILAERRARAAADKKYPPNKPGVTTSDVLKNNTEMWRELISEYEREVAKEFNIDIGLIDSIGLEGIEKEWEFPIDTKSIFDY